MDRIWIRLGFALTEKSMSTYPPVDQPMAYARLADREASNRVRIGRTI